MLLCLLYSGAKMSQRKKIWMALRLFDFNDKRLGL